MAYEITQQVYDALLLCTKKRTGLEDRKESIRHIVVGSSHGDYGFIPELIPGSYNICTPSQDLMHSSLIYQYACGMCPNIQSVIVFYSAFSPGFSLQETSGKWWCAVLKETFSLDISYDCDEIMREYYRFAGITRNSRVPIETYGRLLSLDASGLPEDYGAARRANDHLKHNIRKSQHAHLMTIIGMAKARRHRLLVVIPPARVDYRSFLPPSCDLFSKIFQLRDALKEHAHFEIINLFDRDEFNHEWFTDFDHLRPCDEGARLLTNIVAQSLY